MKTQKVPRWVCEPTICGAFVIYQVCQLACQRRTAAMAIGNLFGLPSTITVGFVLGQEVILIVLREAELVRVAVVPGKCGGFDAYRSR